MYYFMPAWADEDSNLWENTAAPWYWASKKKFDDTVSQLKMFKQAQQAELLISSRYSPFLRSFLAQEELYEVDYYNVFDDIQAIKDVYPRNFDFKDLAWPQGIEFYYTPFIVVARLKDQVWGRIEFSTDGKVLKIIRFKADEEITYWFDDRGFTSSIEIKARNNQRHFQYFLNPFGQWRIRLSVLTGEVAVNQKFAHDFERTEYSNFADLQNEKLKAFIGDNLKPNDTLVVAGANYQVGFIAELKVPRQQVIFSIFAERLAITKDNLQKMGEYGKYFVVDTDSHLQLVTSNLADCRQICNVLQITPFDTRLRLGHSQKEKKLKIFWLLDGSSETEIQNYFREVLDVMGANRLVELVIAANNEWNQQRLTNIFMPIINQHKMADEVTFDFLEQKNDEMEDLLDFKPKLPPKRLIRFVRIYSEETYLEELDDTRIILDLSNEPNLYLQIAGISAGIPQINRITNSYVKSYQNGLIVTSKLQLSGALKYYLESLSHWNQALVYAASQISEYSGTNLINKWNLFLKKETVDE
ncbi:accessory Sec system protein Asp1 [Liquorilactobacillus hordei]|uniref:accessory Sec system protein Asp1 n=1 Tax=Liquorilactobacillus hordei TaxID=468911 RepID=UPI001CC05683|nr:accessory Sec system protein Asp1 [Liquorilactobacillus hordei]MBZ2405249.1 accessory Sec system protein Asp1 [Liquorilactobacillus hordei]